MLQVVAALIERDGRVLICRRTAQQAHPLKWEFPGGKVEPEETPDEALARELEEELAIRQAAGRELTRTRFTYPGKPAIELIFYQVGSFAGEPKNLIFHEIRWALPGELPNFDFLEGDHEFIEWYAANAGRDLRLY
ncbi:MAG: NUDIX domain-containing protein [Acidobacteriia bacterium]|nr:NUDIX domain-containing protein [Terriglobia bacterium]